MSKAASRHLGTASLQMMRIHRQIPDAPADVVRAWPRVTLAAHHLSQALNATATPEGRAIEQIAIDAYSMARANARSDWPGNGPRDQEMLKVAMALEAGAKTVDPQPSRDDAAGHLANALAVLWIGSNYTSGVAKDLANDVEFDRQLTVEQRAFVSARARETARRIDASEQIADTFIGVRDVREPGTSSDRLRQAVATWDIEAHRAMVFDQSTMVLHAVARMEAMTNSAFEQFVDTAAKAGHLDPLTAQRMEPALESLPRSWDAIGDATADLAWSREPLPPGFIAAAENLRDLLDRAIDHATPEEQTHMAGAVKLHAASSMAIASTARDLLEAKELRGPARAVARVAAEASPNQIRSTVDPMDIYNGRTVELPVEVRDTLKPHLDTCVLDSLELVRRTAGLDSSKFTTPSSNDGTPRPQSERQPQQQAQISAPAI